MLGFSQAQQPPLTLTPPATSATIYTVMKNQRDHVGR
jgi:hypothetical protein